MSNIVEAIKNQSYKGCYGLFINGEWVEAKDQKSYEVTTPATGKLIGVCAEASKEDVDKAVSAAWKAFATWKKTNVAERSEILLKIADRIDEHKETLAYLESLDNGKPIRETLNIDIPLASDHFRYFAGAIRAEEGSATQIDENTLSIVLEEPIGVVGQIVPWNFPFLMAAWKLAPALATGNCIVFKPSSETSLSVLEFTNIIADILPPGVLNVLTGRGSTTGNYILEHQDIRKLAFTGSTEVGYEVARYAADKLIPATLELGGKSANIYFEDAPFEKGVEGVCLGILFNQGQVCCAGSRVFVQESIYDKFLAAVKEKFESIKIGLPWEESTQLGSQVSQSQLKKILSYIDVAKEDGASIITGGEQYKENGLENGAFMKPTIIANVTNSMRVAREEIFGPVVCFIKFKDEEEVIRLANDSEYGLGGAVWTRDINRAFKIAKSVESGRIWVNTYNQLPAHTPFGGYKKSGIGRETHKMMLKSYTQTKNIYISFTETPSGFY